jgi:hypothetical protein
MVREEGVLARSVADKNQAFEARLAKKAIRPTIHPYATSSAWLISSSLRSLAQFFSTCC